METFPVDAQTVRGKTSERRIEPEGNNKLRKNRTAVALRRALELEGRPNHFVGVGLFGAQGGYFRYPF